MSLTSLSTSELETLLMEETKKLTSAIREGFHNHDREELRKRIQEILHIMEQRKDNSQGSIQQHGSPFHVD